VQLPSRSAFAALAALAALASFASTRAACAAFVAAVYAPALTAAVDPSPDDAVRVVQARRV